MQLPWELIDYVILHELVHTVVMAHGPKFWDELDKYVNNLAAKRKAIRSHQPALLPQD
jgi:predicted metal-dependent hydrolase